MKTVPPNIWMLVLRIALLGLFAFLYQWPLEKIISGEYQENLPAFIAGFILITLLPAYLLWTLLKVIWVRISMDESKIIFYYLFKSIEAFADEIDGYYSTHHKTKIKNYDGLLIKFKSGKVLELSEYNQKTIKDITDFLNAYKVPYRGTKSSWFPWTRNI